MACADELPEVRRTREEVKQILEDKNQVHVLENHWGRDNRPAKGVGW